MCSLKTVLSECKVYVSMLHVKSNNNDKRIQTFISNVINYKFTFLFLSFILMMVAF